jgi:RNA polymerase sigma-70 factor (ECF subfamily)
MDGSEAIPTPPASGVPVMAGSGTHNVESGGANRAEWSTSLTELHAVYSSPLYRTILRITKNPDDAEDALQETFLRVHQAFYTFEGRSSVYSWMTRVAINCALTLLRMKRSRPETLFDPHPNDEGETIRRAIEDPCPNPEEICDTRQRQFMVMRAIGTLSPNLREPIHLRLTQEASVKEIGRALNISEASVKARLYRARLRLSTMRIESSIVNRNDSAKAIVNGECDQSSVPGTMPGGADCAH